MLCTDVPALGSHFWAWGVSVGAELALQKFTLQLSWPDHGSITVQNPLWPTQGRGIFLLRARYLLWT